MSITIEYRNNGHRPASYRCQCWNRAKTNVSPIYRMPTPTQPAPAKSKRPAATNQLLVSKLHEVNIPLTANEPDET